DLPAAVDLPAQEVHHQRERRMRLELEARRVLEGVTRRNDRVEVGHDVDALAPPLVAHLRVRAELALARREDQRAEHAVDAETAQVLAAPGRQARGHLHREASRVWFDWCVRRRVAAKAEQAVLA